MDIHVRVPLPKARLLAIGHRDGDSALNDPVCGLGLATAKLDQIDPDHPPMALRKLTAGQARERLACV